MIEIYSKLNYNSNGFLLLELELISFINDDENQLSNREINQIISREIIPVDNEVDINKMLNNENSNQMYRISDEFINVRINNTFVKCNKEYKVCFLDLWNNFVSKLKADSIAEMLNIVTKSVPQVVSDSYAILLTKSESIKIVGNSKLYELENKFNTFNDSSYKFIFISEEDWKKFMQSYDKAKKYDIMDESEYINTDTNSVSLAEDVFGTDKLKID